MDLRRGVSGPVGSVTPKREKSIQGNLKSWPQRVSVWPITQAEIQGFNTVFEDDQYAVGVPSTGTGLYVYVKQEDVENGVHAGP